MKNKIISLLLVIVLCFSFLLPNNAEVVRTDKKEVNAGNLVTVYTKGQYNNDFARQIAKEIVDYRSQRGIGSTYIESDLYYTARDRARDMSINYDEIRMLDGTVFTSKFGNPGIACYGLALSAYNIAKCFIDSTRGQIYLMNSRNISIGVGVYKNYNNDYYYVVVKENGYGNFTIPSTTENTGIVDLQALKDYIVEIKVDDLEKAHKFRTNTSYRIQNLLIRNEGLKTITSTPRYTQIENNSATWTSSNTNVATISSDGVLNALNVGTTTIRAQVGDAYEEYEITIQDEPILVESIRLNKSSFTLMEGDTDTINATYSPFNAEDIPVYNIADPSIISISSNGTITALKAGTTTINVHSSNVSVTATVTVNPKPVPVESIDIDDTLILEKGEQRQINVTILPENATNKTINWASTDTTVATVSSTGIVTAKKKGTATIMATTNNGKTALCSVTVTEIPVTGITLSRTSANLVVGQSVPISATVLPINAVNKEITWTSSDSSIASIEDNIITANSVGTATITATTYNGLTATCTVKVASSEVVVTGVTLSESYLVLTETERKTLVATITPSNATNKHITWTSSDPTVVSVSKDGKVTGLKLGQSIITATADNGQNDTCVVEVKESIPLNSISLDQTNITLNKGEKTTLSVIYNPSDTTDYKNVTWTSDENYIATVSSTGEVEAHSIGETTIHAIVGEFEAICTVSVVAEEELSFQDVPKSAWYYESVKEAFNRGIIAGYSPTKFGPNDNVTRGQLVTFLYRIEKEPAVTGTSKFSDVKEGEYYTDPVKWASNNHIVNGYGTTGKFGPNNKIIRQDLAVILNNYAKYKGYSYEEEYDLSGFADYNKVKGGYAEPALKWAVKNSVMSGKGLSNGTKALAPFDNTTRAQAAAMIVNFLDTFNQ